MVIHLFVFAPSEFTGVHGNNERIGVENVTEGVVTFYKLLQEFTVRQ